MAVRLCPQLPARFSPIPILTLALVGCGNSLSLPADGQPTALAVVSGDRQRGRAGAALDNPLVVRLTDAVGRPVMGTAVGFRFLSPTTGGQLTSAVTTDSTGRAATKVVLA